MSEKAKVDKPSPSRINRYGFLALWVGSQLLGWLVYYLAYNSFNQFTNFFNLEEWMAGLLIGLIVGIPTAMAQKFSLYLYFGRWFRGWIRANTFAWALGGISTILVTGLAATMGSPFSLLIPMLTLMLPQAFAQIWVLRRSVQQVWLLLLAVLAGTSVFTATVGQFGGSETTSFAAFGLYALVTGLSLLWLMGTQGAIAKQKLSEAEDFSRLEDDADETEEQDGILTAEDSVKLVESD